MRDVCTHPEHTYRHRQARAEQQLEKQDADAAALSLSRARSLSFPPSRSAVVQAHRHLLAAAYTCLVFSYARSASKAFPRRTEPAYDFCFFFGKKEVSRQ
jgi:hypothetical protein